MKSRGSNGRLSPTGVLDLLSGLIADHRSPGTADTNGYLGSAILNGARCAWSTDSQHRHQFPGATPDAGTVFTFEEGVVRYPSVFTKAQRRSSAKKERANRPLR